MKTEENVNAEETATNTEVNETNGSEVANEMSTEETPETEEEPDTSGEDTPEPDHIEAETEEEIENLTASPTGESTDAPVEDNQLHRGVGK